MFITHCDVVDQNLAWYRLKQEISYKNVSNTATAPQRVTGRARTPVH